MGDIGAVIMWNKKTASCVALALVIASRKKEKKKRRWMKEWFKERKKYTHENLLSELKISEPSDFQNFLRVNSTVFDELLRMVTPEIEKKDTTMRDAIPPSQRLSITLRYLATGNNFEDLKFASAVSPQSIGIIVMETCTAIINCLKDYIKVSKIQQLFQKLYEIYCMYCNLHFIENWYSIEKH